MQSSGKYTVFVSGSGQANVGDRAKMTFHGGQRRGCATYISSRTTSTITGPGQALKDIPSSVLSKVVECLNVASALGNNWKGVATEMLLPYQTVMNLDHHNPEGMMNGVLEIMFERRITVGGFVDILQKIQRPDVIEILIDAGLPRNCIREGENEINVEYSDGNSSLQVVTITTPKISSLTTSSACESNKLNIGSMNNKLRENESVSEDNVRKNSCKLNNRDQPVNIICEEEIGCRGGNSTETDSEVISLNEHNLVCPIITSFMLNFRKN